MPAIYGRLFFTFINFIKMTVFENKYCKILTVTGAGYYILRSKSGKYNDQYFVTLSDAKKAIGVI